MCGGLLLKFSRRNRVSPMPVVEVRVRRSPSVVRKPSPQCATPPKVNHKPVNKSPESSSSDTDSIEEEVQRIITLPPKQSIVDKKRDKKSEVKAMESARAILNAQRSEVVMRDDKELEAIENVRVIVDAQNSLPGAKASVGKPRILAKTGNGVAFIVPIGNGEVAMTPLKLPRRLQKLRSGHSSTEELGPQYKNAENSEVKEQAASSPSLKILKRADWISNEVAKKLAFEQAEADKRFEPSQQESEREVKCSRKAQAIVDAKSYETNQENAILTATEEKTGQSVVESLLHQDTRDGKVKFGQQKVKGTTGADEEDVFMDLEWMDIRADECYNESERKTSW